MAKGLYSLGTSVNAETFDAVMAEARARGLAPSELLRVGLRLLGVPVPTTQRERVRLATNRTEATRPTPPSCSLRVTGLTPHARLSRRRFR